MTKTNKVLNVIWDYFLISFGTLLYCMAWCSFLIPNGISAGGLTGACTILQFATNGAIPVANSFFVMNVILLIMGVMVLGNAFGLKTVYSILLSSLLLKVLPDYHFLEATQGNFLFIDNKLLIPVVGGPIGVIVGPYFGAYIAEVSNGMEREEATRAAMGSFIGVFFGMVLKLICSIWMFVELLVAIF